MTEQGKRPGQAWGGQRELLALLPTATGSVPAPGLLVSALQTSEPRLPGARHREETACGGSRCLTWPGAAPARPARRSTPRRWLGRRRASPGTAVAPRRPTSTWPWPPAERGRRRQRFTNAEARRSRGGSKAAPARAGERFSRV